MSHIKLLPSQSTPAPTLLVLKLLINHPFVGLFHLQILSSPVCMNKCVDDAPTHALNMKTLTAASGPPAECCPTIKVMHIPVQEYEFTLPASKCLFIYFSNSPTRLRWDAQLISQLAGCACLHFHLQTCLHFPPSQQREPASCLHQQAQGNLLSVSGGKKPFL